MSSVDYEEQKGYWEGRKERRSPDHPVVRAFSEPKLELILDALPDAGDEELTMLEIGAGNGYLSRVLDSAFELTALDFSPNMLAMNPLDDGQKIVGDAENLEFSDDSFDIVFCGNLLHHLERPIVAVEEMRRVARKHVILLEPNRTNPLMFAFGLAVKEERGSLKFSRHYVETLGLRAGMKLRIAETQGSIVPNKTPRALLPLIQKIDGTNPLGFYHLAIFDV